MGMKPEDALEQVAYMRDLIERTRARAVVYWPYFVLWGSAWAVAYLWQFAGGTPLVWMVVVTLAGVGNVVISRRSEGGRAPAPPLIRRLALVMVLLFVVLTGLVVPLVRADVGAQIACGPMIIGLLYIVAGIFLGARLAGIGLWLIVAGAVSLAMPTAVALAWMSVAGGGSQIGLGLVLRRRERRRQGG